MRKAGKIDSLDVLLESKGGNLDSAYKILQLLKSYANQVTVIVPNYAKSAATIIALGAHRLQMCRAGELGPLDPQVWDPASDEMVPALAVKKGMDFIKSVENPFIILNLTDKISPLLMGAYRIAEETSKQYLNEIFKSKGFEGKMINELVDMFTEMLLSHGYPMSGDFLKEHNVPVEDLEESEEESFADLHNMIIEYCTTVSKNEHTSVDLVMILQDTVVTMHNNHNQDLTDS